MSNNYIIGSGVVGLLARKILPNWGLISQRPSRYYSFDPALADNYITYSKESEDRMKVVGVGESIVEYKSPYSISGQLVFQEHGLTGSQYLRKVYGSADRGKVRTHMWIHTIPVSKLYNDLIKEYKSKKVDPTEVVKIDTDKKLIYIKNSKKPVEYDNIISTVPLDVLYKWIGIDAELESKTICYYHIFSENVDLEGSDQSYVVDDSIDFFKVTKIKQNQHLFWSFDQIDNPHNYFGMYLGYSLNIIDSFRVESAMPIGPLPDLRDLEGSGIHCVGSNARWDDFIGIADCINKVFEIQECLS
jgi:hypothetical protein